MFSRNLLHLVVVAECHRSNTQHFGFTCPNSHGKTRQIRQVGALLLVRTGSTLR
jgi:hypothetical protein